jgi:hypothetical protein
MNSTQQLYNNRKNIKTYILNEDGVSQFTV